MHESSLDPTGVAIAEFPRDLLPLLRCSRDGGPLVISGDLQNGVVGVIEARLRCGTCTAEYRIQAGIARMMEGTLTPEVKHEMSIIDGDHGGMRPGPFVPPDFGWRSKLSDLLEIPPHLNALRPLDSCRVLELGCGDGRFTMLMAQMGARVLAVDLSINALTRLASWLPSGVAPTAYQPAHTGSAADLRARVGLVQADASHFHVAQRGFDRALSATPLDSRDERMRMYRTIADALTDEGWFVGGVEHYDLIRRLLGYPRARRYTEGGIFIEHFETSTVRREAAPFFSELRIRPIRPLIPFVRRLPLSLAVWMLRTVGALPVLRHAGQILLLRAGHPVRPPAEGANRPGNWLAKSLFRICRQTKLGEFF